MKYPYKFEKDPFFGDVRLILTEEIDIFSEFLEDISTPEEANKYLEILENVLNETHEDFEIRLNATSVFMKKDVTVAEHFFRNDPPYKNTMETEEFKKLLLIWRDKISEDI